MSNIFFNLIIFLGLKDCHVLTFTSSGSVAEHLVLHPQLDANNFIIKAVWMPGSQTGKFPTFILNFRLSPLNVLTKKWGRI